MTDSIRENVETIKRVVAESAIAAGRSPDDVKIVPATKTVSAERINELLSCGIDTIGENRVQELLEKYDALDKRFHIHFIGKLQTNKVKYIVDKVSMIQSVDTLHLCEEISKRSLAIGKVMEVLVEINVGREASKSGIFPEDVVDFVRRASAYEGIRIVGLMTIPPPISALCVDNSQKIYNCGSYFTKVKELSLDLLKERIDNITMRELSMGMSEDYAVAVSCGATIIRPGRAIFGERHYVN